METKGSFMPSSAHWGEESPLDGERQAVCWLPPLGFISGQTEFRKSMRGQTLWLVREESPKATLPWYWGAWQGRAPPN
jgi:hypothetical protein